MGGPTPSVISPFQLRFPISSASLSALRAPPQTLRDTDRGVSMATSRIALPATEFPLHVPVGIGGYGVTLEMKDYEVLRDEKAEFTEPCFDLGLAYELDRLGKGDRMILIRGASLRAARTASKADHLIFGSAFGFEALAIPLCTRHCSVLLVVRPGDLLLPDEEEIGTFYRHLDPKTSSKRHEEEAANVLRFFGECVKAELNRGGRQWTAAPPSAKVLSERLESLAAPIRDVSFQRPCRLVAWAIVVQASTHPFRRRHVLRMLMQKLPDILKEEVAGTGLLAVNAFAWSLEHLDDVHRSYDPLIVENPKMVGLKALRLELLHHAEKAASNEGEAASTVARGVGTAIALEEEDVEREEDDVAVTGEEEAVQFAGEKVADKSGGSGPNLGKKARGSSGSTPTRMASKAAIERLKAAEREIKKLREEKLVAEKRLEFQTARNDTMYGVVTSAVNKLTTVAEGVTHLEQTSGRSIQTAVDAMRAVVQEAVSYRGSTLEFMNTQWLPTVQALHLTATAAQGRRREDDLLLLRGVADALGQKIKTVVSAEVKAAMEGEAQRIAAPVTAKVVQELRDDLVKAVTSATQQGIGTAGFSLLPTALASVMHGGRATAEESGPAPRQSGKRVADEKSLTGDQTSGSKRSRGPAVKRGVGVDPPAPPYVRIPGVHGLLKDGLGARPSEDFRQVDVALQDPQSVVGKTGGQPVGDKQPQAPTDPPSAHDAPPSCDQVSLADELMGEASVVAKQGWQPTAEQHPHPEASPATAQGARPSGGTAQMADDMHVAAVVAQARGEPVAVQHVQPSTSTPTARPTGVTAQLPDDLLRPAAVVGQQGGPPGAGQHLHPSTSTPTAQDARPAGVTALVDELLRQAAVVGQQGGPPGTGQHPPTATSPAGATALVDELLRPAAVVGQHVQQAAGAASLPVHGAMVAAEPIPIPTAVESRAVEALVRQKPSFDEYLKWLEDQGQKTPVIPPTHSNQAVDQGAEAANVAAATAGPSGSTVEAAVWRAAEEAGGVDEEILASIVMPDPEIEVMREKLQAAAPTVGAQQGAPAASTAPAEDHSAAGAKSPPATTGEVGDGKQKRKGKDKAKGGPAKVGSSKGTSKAAAQGRKGSGVCVDPSNGLAVSEMKFGKKSRYICRSMDKSEAAYCIAVAVSSFDGFVSDVVLEEFGGVKEEVMAQYKADWNVERLIPGGMWMVMWSRGANVFRDRFQQVVAEYNRITGADRAALMLALRPAVWFGDLPESTEPEKAAKKKVASDMIARVSMCAAFAPVAAKVTPIPGVGSERLSEILAGTAAAVWCFSETNATAEVAAGEGGAAATMRGASNEFASRCRTVIEAVLQRAASRVVVVGEVAETVMKDLQAAMVRSLPEVGEEREHDELIARVMIENLAFWGDCNVGGPKLKARGVDLPIDPQMKIIIRDRGARGQQHKGKQVADA
ncbi:unnamed protein product [Closterium sp. NIES-64]|nr:unnamed protein product [Closterium sp. NIES-64]